MRVLQKKVNRIISAVLIGFFLSIVLIGFSLFLFYSSFNNKNAIVQDYTKTSIEDNVSSSQQENESLLNSPNNKTTLEKSEWDKFLDSKISGILLGSTISTTVSLLLYFFNRRNAKKQLIFDVALKNLLPAVYMPILGELRLHNFNNKDINVHKIEGVILDNGSLINFAPKKIQSLLDELFSLSKLIVSSEIYKEKESVLIKQLQDLEKEIMKRFGALIG